MREINRIVVHCSFTKPRKGRAGSPLIGAKEIRKWHTDPVDMQIVNGKKVNVGGRGWRDIGYHYVIKRDGTTEKGRPDNVQGAHVGGHNEDSLGICLVGGMEKKTGLPINDYTSEEWAALELLVRGLVSKHGPDVEVCGHNNLTNSKTCPNFDVKQWWNEL